MPAKQKKLKKRIEVEHVTKKFNFKTERRDSIKEVFINPFKKVENRIFTAVDDISFTVEDGEFLGIIGRNGSGKSTILKMLAGIYEPNEGYITVRGKLVPFLELGVGFNFELSARENVYLNGTILGLSAKNIHSKFRQIIKFAELEEFLELPLKNFSSGMTVRLAFSIAINIPADIYLIDEVLAVGDTIFQEKCLNVFKQFKKDKKTIVFVSHDMESIKRYCDRTIMIHDHKIASEGEPEQVVYKYLRSLEQ